MNSNKEIIKTSSRFWIEEIGGIFAVLIVFPIFGIFYWGKGFYFISGLGLIVGVLNLLREFPFAYNSQLIFSNSEINGQIGKFHFSESRENIKAVQLSGSKATSLLTLWTEKNIIRIPCKYFDQKRLNELLKEYLPLDVFRPFAYKKLPQFQEWQNEKIKQYSNLQEPLKVSLGKSEQFIGGISLFFSLIMVVLLYFNKGNIIPITLIIFFGGLGLFLILLSIGKIEATNDYILVRNLFTEHELVWQELQEVYVDSNKHIMALVGNKSRIILASPASWSGKNRERLYEFIEHKIEISKIEVTESRKHLFWRSKNFEP